MDVGNISNPTAFSSLGQTPLKTEHKQEIKAKEETLETQEIQDQGSDQTKDTIKKAVLSINKEIESLGTKLSFGYNTDIDQLVVEVKDKVSGEVIRKLPTEEALNLAKKIKELVGIIFDKKA